MTSESNDQDAISGLRALGLRPSADALAALVGQRTSSRPRAHRGSVRPGGGRATRAVFATALFAEVRERADIMSAALERFVQRLRKKLGAVEIEELE